MKNLKLSLNNSTLTLSVDDNFLAYFISKYNELTVFLNLALAFIFKYDFLTILERMLTYSGPLRSILIFIHKLNCNNPVISNCHESIFENLSVNEIGKNLKSDGFSEGISLSAECINEIYNYAVQTPAEAEDKTSVVIKPDNYRAPLNGIYNYFYYNPHLKNKLVSDIGRDPGVLEIVKNYFGGVNPILYSSKLYWSFARIDQHGKIISQNNRKLFHFDVSDSKSLSLFFYLTDVDENTGPHSVIRSTHGNRSLFQLLNDKISDTVAEKKFGKEIKTITGKKGHGFFEDLLNYHKHSWALKPDPRLILNFCYTIHRKP